MNKTEKYWYKRPDGKKPFTDATNVLEKKYNQSILMYIKNLLTIIKKEVTNCYFTMF